MSKALMQCLSGAGLGLLLCSTAYADWQRIDRAGMSLWLFSPSSPSKSLMLNLHGCGQRADALKELGNWEKAGMHVAIPDVPDGGVVLGCWNYYGKEHTAANKHNGPLIALASGLKSELGLERVFVSGLSSGGTQALLVGCLRPDLFEGVAVAAGAALGSELSELGEPKIKSGESAELCLKLAGAHSFAHQKVALVRGERDFVVSILHTGINAEAMAAVLGAGPGRPGDLRGFPGVNLEGSSLSYFGQSGLRMLEIMNEGLGHNWPAGNSRESPAVRGVNPNSVDLPLLLASFFAPQATEFVLE